MILLFTFIYFRNGLKLSGGENSVKTFIDLFGTLYNRISVVNPKIYDRHLRDVTGLYYVMRKVKQHIKPLLIIDSFRTEYLVQEFKDDTRKIYPGIYKYLTEVEESKTEITNKSEYVINLFRSCVTLDSRTTQLDSPSICCDFFRAFNSLNITYKKILFASENQIPSTAKNNQTILLKQLCDDYVNSINVLHNILTPDECEYLKFLYEISGKHSGDVISYNDIERKFELMILNCEGNEVNNTWPASIFEKNFIIDLSSELNREFSLLRNSGILKYRGDHECSDIFARYISITNETEDQDVIGFVRNITALRIILFYMRKENIDAKSIDISNNVISGAINCIHNIQGYYLINHANRDDLKDYINEIHDDINYYYLSLHMQTIYPIRKIKSFVSSHNKKGYRIGEYGQLYRSEYIKDNLDGSSYQNLYELISKNIVRYLGMFKETKDFEATVGEQIEYDISTRNSNAGVEMLIDLSDLIEYTFCEQNSDEFGLNYDMMLTFGLFYTPDRKNMYIMNNHYVCSPKANYMLCPDVVRISETSRCFVCDITTDSFYFNSSSKGSSSNIFKISEINNFIENRNILHPFMLINKSCVFQGILKILNKNSESNFLDSFLTIPDHVNHLRDDYDLMKKFIANIPKCEIISITYDSKFMSDNIFSYVAEIKIDNSSIMNSISKIITNHVERKYKGENTYRSCHVGYEIPGSGGRMKLIQIENVLCIINDKAEIIELYDESKRYKTIGEFISENSLLNLPENIKLKPSKTSKLDYRLKFRNIKINENAFKEDSVMIKLEVLCFLIMEAKIITPPSYARHLTYDFVNKYCIFDMHHTVKECIENCNRWFPPFANYISEIFNDSLDKTIGDIFEMYLVEVEGDEEDDLINHDFIKKYYYVI